MARFSLIVWRVHVCLFATWLAAIAAVGFVQMVYPSAIYVDPDFIRGEIDPWIHFVAATMLTWAFAIPPFIIVNFIGGLLFGRGAKFYIGGVALIGFLISLGHIRYRPTVDDWLVAVVVITLAGAVGGVVYWFITSRDKDWNRDGFF